MNRSEKTAQIAEVKARFDKAISAALLDFQGLSVETVTALRREFRKAGVEYKVVKNTIIRHALKNTPYEKIVGDLTPGRKAVTTKPHAALRGMTAIAWSNTDPAAPAKVVEAFKKANAPKADKLTIKTGLVSGDLVSGEVLAKMPGLKETQGQIIGMLMAPGANLYMSLVAPGAMLVAILEAMIAKRKAAGETE